MGSRNSTKSSGTGGRGSDRSGQQETNRRKNEVNPNVVKAGTKKVKKAIKKSGTNMYGGEASKATNEYLLSIGEAKRGSKNADGSYNYMLTSKGHKMKYGTYNAGGPQNPTGMGTVGKGGIMNQVPISKEMFESQKRTQMIATGAMAALGIPIMGAAFADYNSKKYSDYRKSFQANKAMGEVNYSSPTTQSTETANLGMGDITDVANNNKKKSKTTKSTSKFFTGVNESTDKRNFFV